MVIKIYVYINKMYICVYVWLLSGCQQEILCNQKTLFWWAPI